MVSRRMSVAVRESPSRGCGSDSSVRDASAPRKRPDKMSYHCVIVREIRLTFWSGDASTGLSIRDTFWELCNHASAGPSISHNRTTAIGMCQIWAPSGAQQAHSETARGGNGRDMKKTKPL